MISGRKFFFLMVALWLANILPALDATLVGTALPTIIGELNGLERYSWVFSAYLLALTISIPIGGKLTDLFGRKLIYFLGIALFTVGGLASAVVQTTEQLILCRVIIGVATGFIGPASMTIMGDAIPLERRAKLQWIFASAWFLSSLIGPAISTVLTAYVSWRLVFLVTVPLGLVGAYLLATQYEEHVESKSHRIDYRGVALLGLGVLALLFALSPNNKNGIDLASSGGLLAAAVVLLVLFFWNELRASEPVLPPRLFLISAIGIAAIASLASGFAQSGATSFIPIFVQGGQGGTVADVGLVLPWMTIGWPIGAGVGGRMLLRVGFRRAIIAGMLLVLAAQAGFLVLDRESPTWAAAACMALMGLGFGFSTVGFTISVQNSVGWGDRGVATAALQFFRSIGGSVGVAIMGTIVTIRMQPLLQATNAGSNASALLDPASRARVAPDTLAVLQQGMVDAVHVAFLVMAVAAIVGFVAVLWFPKVVRMHTPEAEQPPEPKPPSTPRPSMSARSRVAA